MPVAVARVWVSGLEYAEWCEYFALCDEEEAGMRAAMFGGGQRRPRGNVNTRGAG